MDKIYKVALVAPALKEETALHIRKVQAQMEERSALLVSANVNLFYCTGRFFRGYVWLPKEGEPLYFLVKPQIYSEEPEVIGIRKPEQIPDILQERGYALPGRVGIEEDELTYATVRRLMNLFPDADFYNGTPCLRAARMVKTPYEIEQMRIDGKKQMAVYGKISSLYTPGLTDIGLQIAIERELRLEGCLGFPRVAGNLMEINMGSVLAGDNADNPSPYEFAMGGAGADASLPGGADGRPLLKGETIMVDMNGAFNAYQTDMTRVWTLGSLPDEAYRAHDCSRRILRTLERETRPGMEISELYFKALALVEDEGLKPFFMGHRQQSGFIGHGVGIELNEQPPVTPRNKTVVSEGMTLALEPKFVLPGIGAVGVENTYVVGDDGLENLTPFPEEIQEFR